LNESINIIVSLQLTTLLILSAHLKKKVRRDLLNSYVNKCKKIHEITICSKYNVNFSAFKRNILCVRKNICIERVRRKKRMKRDK